MLIKSQFIATFVESSQKVGIYFLDFFVCSKDFKARFDSRVVSCSQFVCFRGQFFKNKVLSLQTQVTKARPFDNITKIFLFTRSLLLSSPAFAMTELNLLKNRPQFYPIIVFVIPNPFLWKLGQILMV